MAGVNPGAAGPGGPGGPVGGIPMMNTGSSAPGTNNSNTGSNPSNASTTNNNASNQPDPLVLQLNTYIYDYFLKRGYHESARALAQDESAPLNTVPQSKAGRRDGEVNGVDGDAMLTDSKDDSKKIPDDLPRPALSGDQHDSSFLFDWWNLFWDIFSAQRRKNKPHNINDPASQYLTHTQYLQKAREQNAMRQIPPNNQFGMRGMRPPGMMPPNLQKSVLQNSAQNMNPQQLAAFKSQQAQMMQQQQAQMQREQSDMEMNGHRPQSPSSVENAPSPSKRPRLDGSQPNGQQMTPNGRGQGQAMPGQPNPQTSAMLMQHGINPRTLTQQQFQALQAQNPAAQAKAVQGIPNGMMNPGVMPNQEMIPMPDGQDMLQMQEYYGANAQLRPGPQTPGGNGQGNHALHDYQMQLMILESQNKKRLLLARQEQPQGANGEGGQQGMPPRAALPPGTSPQESRTGGSPNPNDQMKRGTPKLPQNGIPGSPSVGDAAMAAQNRSSPASMNFAGQMPPEMGGAAFLNMKGMPEGVVGPNGMRPPSSNPAFSGPQVPQQMEAMARAQQGQAQVQGQGPGAPNRMPSGGNWQQQQPQQQPPQQGVPPQGQQQQQAGGPSQQQQQQPAGTPQERNAMPPPQAPPASAAGANATGRTQTSSPQPGGAAPPTPQQPNKPAPKKNEGKEKARKRPPAKKNAAAANANANAATTAATPSSEAEPPPTPTTPITPGHPNALNKNAANNAQQATSAPGAQAMAQPQPPQQPQQPPPQPQQTQQQGQQQPPQQPPQQQPQQDPSQNFGDMSLPENNFNLDFTALDNPDILENFDFDSFLNTDDASGFTFDPSMSYPTDGVEAGTGEGL